jgi:hypothetical protein
MTSSRPRKKTDRTDAKKVAQAHENMVRHRISEAHVRRVMTVTIELSAGTS